MLFGYTHAQGNENSSVYLELNHNGLTFLGGLL